MKHLFHHQELLVRLQEEPSREPMKNRKKREEPKTKKHTHETLKAAC